MLIYNYKDIDKAVLNDIIKHEGKWFIIDRILKDKKILIVTEI